MSAEIGSSGSSEAVAALDGLRVLEIAGGFGGYTGKMLAGLGAEVLLLEPPCGANARRRGPFVDGVPSPTGSLHFAYLHAGKRGITIDLDDTEGQELCRGLAATADVVIEGEPVGVMAARGLGYEALAEVRPSLVYTSISPFGQEGPYASYVATDLVLLAMGGLLYLGGSPDTEPVRVHGDQAVLAADQYAGVGTLLALLHAEQTGLGRRVDVSAQESVVVALENAAQFYDLEGVVRRRSPARQQAGRGIYPCKDGYVYLMAMAKGVGAVKYWQPTVQYLIDEGVSGAEQLLDPKWLTSEWSEKDEAKDIFAEMFVPFAAQRTKAELHEAAQQHRFPLGPVNTPADLLENRQLAARGYFASVQDDRLGRVLTMPGAPYQLSETPWGCTGPAPSLGQDNADVYRELGLTPEDLEHLASRGVI